LSIILYPSARMNSKRSGSQKHVSTQLVSRQEKEEEEEGARLAVSQGVSKKKLAARLIDCCRIRRHIPPDTLYLLPTTDDWVNEHTGTHVYRTLKIKGPVACAKRYVQIIAN
jgi:hypothetical protein